jgi:L-serine dehydratase
VAFISIFNDILGPVMRGPSSSHTAGAYRIGLIVRDLFGAEPLTAKVVFDPKGSMAPTWRPLGVDLAFTSGLMDWSMLDERYFDACDRARAQGVVIDFAEAPLEDSDHPNAMSIEIESTDRRRLRVVAEAVGGGGIRIVRLDGRPVNLDGKMHCVVAEDENGELETTRSADSVDRDVAATEKVWTAAPVFFVRRGDPLFSSADAMVTLAEERGVSLGEIALVYESELLGITRNQALQEMQQRYDVMERSVAAGLDDRQSNMLLLQPTASRVFSAEREGRLAIGGIHARAAARALAVMHHCNSRGVICAAPTGGSAGTVPGVVVSLVEEMDLSDRQIAFALLAASAVGLIVARRATFAAEIAGCQVEIGVAGAMAAAAVVEAVGGSPRQAADAAAISLQNTMGSPCDPVAGACEVPCHTRNAVAASSAFTCADLIIGGYANPIPLDETIDASYEVGKNLPGELRCTARGGCAVTPSALRLPLRR